MIGGIVNKTREDEREERKREREEERKREKGEERERERERTEERERRERGPPCVHSTRPRVCVQNVPVCTGSMPTCFFSCGHVAGTHGDILNAHTGTC